MCFLDEGNPYMPPISSPFAWSNTGQLVGHFNITQKKNVFMAKDYNLHQIVYDALLMRVLISLSPVLCATASNPVEHNLWSISNTRPFPIPKTWNLKRFRILQHSLHLRQQYSIKHSNLECTEEASYFLSMSRMCIWNIFILLFNTAKFIYLKVQNVDLIYNYIDLN